MAQQVSDISTGNYTGKNHSLLSLIDLLPDIDRQAISLFYLEEMTIR